MLVRPGNLMGGFKKKKSSSSPVYLPTVGAFASLGNIDVTSLTNRTVSSSQFAGTSSPASPLKYNTLTINAGAGLNIDPTSYSGIFIWCNTLVLGASNSFFSASATDGETVQCACGVSGGVGGSGGSGGGGGTGPVPSGNNPEAGASGGSGAAGSASVIGIDGGAGWGHAYSGAFAFLSGGNSGSGISGGAGFGGGGSSASSELISCGCPCSCSPCPTYGATAGGGGGGGLVYVVANSITGGAGRAFANGGNAGINGATSNLTGFGGGGGVVMMYARTKAAGTILTQVLGGSNSGLSGNTSIQQINGPTNNSANSLTAKTFNGSW